MRIAMLAPATPSALAHHLSPTDAERARGLVGLGGTPITTLVEALLADGHQVDLLTLDRGVTGLVELAGGRLRIAVGGYRPRARDRARDLFAAERGTLAAMLAASPADVVHAHWTYEFAWAALACGRPLVVTAHDAPMTVLRHMPDAYRLARTAMAWRVRLGRFVLTAVSPVTAAMWRREMLYRREVLVTPNAVPPSTRDDGPAARPFAARYVTVANATPLKNVAALLEAFPAVAERVPDATLTLIGPGLEPDGELARRARGIRGVNFVGPCPHEAVLARLRGADVLVHPSHEESFGMVVVEAMALGLPVVGGRRSGALPWMIGGSDGCGLLVDVTSPSALSAAMLALAKDERLRLLLARRAVARAQDTFAPGAVATSYISAYETARCPGAGA